MTRREYFNLIRDNYYIDRTFLLDNLKDMVRSVAPIFGELEVEIKDIDGGKEIFFIDNDEGDIIIAPDEMDTSEINTDMSTVAFSLTVNENNIIDTVNSNMGFFTKANKDLLLFSGHLVGKKVEL